MLVKALRPLAVLAGALIVVWLVWEIGIATLVHVGQDVGRVQQWQMPKPAQRAPVLVRAQHQGPEYGLV